MSDVQQWLEAVLGNWRHVLGAAGLGAVVALAVVLVERFLRRPASWRAIAAVFLLCFGADVTFLQWRDPRVPVQAHVQLEPPPPVPVSRKVIERVAGDMMNYYVARDGTRPQAEKEREAYDADTVNEFKLRFGTVLTDLLASLSATGSNTSAIEVVYQELSDPKGIRDIAVTLNAMALDKAAE